MLELRPTCEHCNKSLPPDSKEAMICSFECTFCKSCVESVLHNVCPSCGGGFCLRPVRPSKKLKNSNYLGMYPATTKINYQPVDSEEHTQFADKYKNVPPEERWKLFGELNEISFNDRNFYWPDYRLLAWNRQRGMVSGLEREKKGRLDRTRNEGFHQTLSF